MVNMIRVACNIEIFFICFDALRNVQESRVLFNNIIYFLNMVSKHNHIGKSTRTVSDDGEMLGHQHFKFLLQRVRVIAEALRVIQPTSQVLKCLNKSTIKHDPI